MLSKLRSTEFVVLLVCAASIAMMLSYAACHEKPIDCPEVTLKMSSTSAYFEIRGTPSEVFASRGGVALGTAKKWTLEDYLDFQRKCAKLKSSLALDSEPASFVKFQVAFSGAIDRHENYRYLGKTGVAAFKEVITAPAVQDVIVGLKAEASHGSRLDPFQILEAADHSGQYEWQKGISLAAPPSGSNNP